MALQPPAGYVGCKLAQNFLRVLAQQRRRPEKPPSACPPMRTGGRSWRRRPSWGCATSSHAPVAARWGSVNKSSSFIMGITGMSLAASTLSQCFRAAGAQVLLHHAIDSVAVGDARALGGEAGVGFKPLWLAHQREKRPSSVRRCTSARRHGRPWWHRACGWVPACGCGPLDQWAAPRFAPLRCFAQHKLQQAFEHGHFHALATPGAHPAPAARPMMACTMFKPVTRSAKVAGT
jgi:hypothetical protein